MKWLVQVPHVLPEEEEEEEEEEGCDVIRITTQDSYDSYDSMKLDGVANA